MKIRIPLVVAGLLAASSLTGHSSSVLEAQARVSLREVERGWIGISFDIESDRWGRVLQVVITDVSSGSPAADAGLRSGDLLLSVNELERANELAELNDRLHLSPGDDVVMEILRNGDRQRLHMEAAPLPDAFDVSLTYELSLEAESMVETWQRAMDSLRVELVAQGGQKFRIERSSGARGNRITVVRGNRGESFVPEAGRSVQPPFEFFVFRGEEHDSLRQEMVEVNRVAAELGERLAVRERELRQVMGTTNPGRFTQDYEFRQLRAALDQVSLRSAELETAMAMAARTTAGFDYTTATPGVQSTLAGREQREQAEFRPLTPYLLGRNRVAGAEVTDLPPELAEYFEVSAGVLVTGVAPGTPAAMAGIVPGDVITRIDQVGVRSVEDLRFGVSMAGDTLPVVLIRHGTSIQVLLRR